MAKNNNLTDFLTGIATKLRTKLSYASTTKINPQNFESEIDKLTYTHDADAAAGNILSGKTAYVDGAKVTGTMTNNGAVSQTLAVNGSYTIPAGYHNGSGKVTQSVTTRDSSSLSASGATVSVPAGYYASAASKSVATVARAATTCTAVTNANSDAIILTAGNNQGTGYVTGSNQTKQRTITLTTSGRTVYAQADGETWKASKSIAAGSATTPATTITKNPSISVNASGLITASVSGTQSVTPTVSAGYVSSGTAGTITVSGSGTKQLTTKAATTITPTTSSQTAVSAGTYCTGAITVGAIKTQAKTVSASPQVVYPDSGYYLSSVTINAKTFSVDLTNADTRERWGNTDGSGGYYGDFTLDINGTQYSVQNLNNLKKYTGVNTFRVYCSESGEGWDGAVGMHYTMGGEQYSLLWDDSAGWKTVPAIGDIVVNSFTYMSCLPGDTMITMADGTEKRIDALEKGDYVLGVDPATNELVPTKLEYCNRCAKPQFSGSYDVWTFDDGSFIKTVKRHRLYNVDKQAMMYMDEWDMGDKAYTKEGKHVSLVGRKTIYEKVQHFTLFTEHETYFANGFLAGNRLTPELHIQ